MTVRAAACTGSGFDACRAPELSVPPRLLRVDSLSNVKKNRSLVNLWLSAIGHSAAGALAKRQSVRPRRKRRWETSSSTLSVRALAIVEQLAEARRGTSR